MNELSARLRKAVDFLKKNGYARFDAEIARMLGVRYPALCMALNGSRTPTWELLLDFCDNYPINFWWLRTGEGYMIKDERELMLLRRIEELEREIALLKGQ